MDFVEKAKELFGKGTEVSKKAVKDAGNAIQEFSDKSVLKLEIKKLESNRKDTCSEFGEYTFGLFKDSDSVQKSDEKIKAFLDKILEIDNNIAIKEKALSDLEEKKSEKA